MSAEPKDGGPAFPDGTDRMGCEGMSLRDYFAGQAIGAILSAGDERQSWKSLAQYAQAAYAVADEMLVARQRTRGEAKALMGVKEPA